LVLVRASVLVGSSPSGLSSIRLGLVSDLRLHSNVKKSTCFLGSTTHLLRLASGLATTRDASGFFSTNRHRRVLL
jgi:hypothetical protein